VTRTKFFIDDPMGRNVVQVQSVAPLEAMLFRSTDITGEIEIDTDNILDKPSVSLTVPVASLDGGVPLLSEVLRGERWLDAAKFPQIVFSLAKIVTPTTPTALRDGAPVPVTAEGTFEFHGVSKRYPIKGEITWFKANENTARRLPGDLLRLRASFDLHLREHGVEAHLSAQTFGKVSETLAGSIDLFASTQRPTIPEDMLKNLARARRELGQRLAQG
jgi:polyisoprenoid-binding protein YceI